MWWETETHGIMEAVMIRGSVLYKWTAGIMMEGIHGMTGNITGKKRIRDVGKKKSWKVEHTQYVELLISKVLSKVFSNCESKIR